MTQGYMIVIEGPDGVGKGTLISNLSDHFNKEGRSFIYTREPGGTVIGEKLRDIVLDVNHSEMSDITEAYLYATSRVQHVEEKILPAISSGDIVICDRFALSSICYQGYGRGFSVDMIKDLNKYALERLKDKMITIVLMAPPEVGIKRKKGQQALDRLELAGKEFHERVYTGYVKESSSMTNTYVVSATQSIDDVFAEVLSILEKHTI